jgi:hypothetical protein
MFTYFHPEIPFRNYLRELTQKKKRGLGMVAHTCNPNYIGGRDWEDENSKPAWAKVHETSISNIKS